MASLRPAQARPPSRAAVATPPARYVPVRHPGVPRRWDRASWTRETVCEAVRDWHAERRRPPTYHEWTPSRTRPGVWEAQSPRWPSAAVVCDLYRDREDPWNAALVEAGATVRFRRWSDDAIRAALGGFWARTGRPPTPADLHDPEWPGPRAPTLRRRYGGVAAAWRALGPAPAGRGSSPPSRGSGGSSCGSTGSTVATSCPVHASWAR